MELIKNIFIGFLPTTIFTIVLLRKEHFVAKDSFWKKQKWKSMDAIFIILSSILLQLSGILLGFFEVISYYYLFVYGSIILLIVQGGILHWILSFKYKMDYSVLGITKKNLYKNLAIGFFVFLSYEFISSTLFLLFKSEPFLSFKAQPFIRMGFNQFPVFGAIIFIFGLIVLSPIVEECVFRGFLYTPFQKRVGAFGGICSTSAIWATTHLQPKAIFALFLLGVILGYTYKRTKSVIPCIAMHCLMSLSKLFCYFIWLHCCPR